MPLLQVRDLRTYFYLEGGGVVKAVDGVSFELEKGEAVGIVGESGCGKTTLALSIMRLVPPPGRIVGGQIIYDGMDLTKMGENELRRVRWKRISMVFQGSMNALNPVIRVGQQIAEALMLHEKDMDREAALKRAGELLELVGIPRDRVDNYPFEFSGGMRQRALIAMALACNPELVILDEPATALDVIVQANVMRLVRELKEKLGISVLMITHDLALVTEVCERAVIMYAGKLAEYADLRSIYKSPLHPYTQGLIKSYPRLYEEKRRLYAIPGFPPDLVNPPPGCRFHPRCAYAMDICRRQEPRFIDTGGRKYVACHLIPGCS